MNKKGSILCINYFFPPLSSTGVVRSYEFSQVFAKRFHKVYVITSGNHKYYTKEIRNNDPNVEVLFFNPFDYRYLLGLFSKKEKAATFQNDHGVFIKFLFLLKKSFPTNLIFGEGGIFYIYKAYRTASKLIQNNNITTIYSSFGPYADHYIAYFLKRKFPKIKWIADFRDLQIEPIYKNVYWESYQRKIEQKVLNKADLVTTVSEGLVEHLKLYQRKTISVLRGVKLRHPQQQFQKFTISYTGSLLYEYRDPRPMFQAIKSLIQKGEIEEQDIELIYAGKDGAQYLSWAGDMGLTNITGDKGSLSSTEAQDIQSKSHINLLLTSSSPELSGVLTGKIFEYFESLNTTICLIKGVKDPEFEALFNELNAGIVVYNPEIIKNNMETFILSKYKEWKSTGEVKSKINKAKILENYSWENQVDKMLNAVSEKEFSI